MATKDVFSGIKRYEEEIRTMDAEWLRKEFGFVSSGRLNVAKLIRNLIWQAYTNIRDGKRETIDSNIRGFWYTDVKPVLSRLGLQTEGRTYTERVYDCLLEMVAVHRLFNYADFGFVDETEGMKYIGKTNVHVVVFVEKDGLFPIVRRLAEKYDCVGVSTGGYPSILSAEYLIRGIARHTHLRHHFDVLSIVDYDPNGWIIEKEFVEQLRLFDMEDLSLHQIVHPKHLSEEQIELSKYRLKAVKKTKSWVEETGGLNGEAYGVEANAFTSKQIEEIFVSHVGERLREPEEEVPIASRVEAIEKRLEAIEELMRRMLEQMGMEEEKKEAGS